MDGFSHLSPDERAAMDALRARLRAKAEEVVTLVEAVVDEVKTADTSLTVDDGWRCVRLMRQADTMVCQLYATPESVVKPHAVKPGRPRFEDDEDDALDEEADKAALSRRLHGVVCEGISGVANHTGFWPNGDPVPAGQRIDPDNAADVALMEITAVFASYPDREPEGVALFEYLVLNAINASIQHGARHCGVWPDGSPFDPQVPDPGFYSLADDRDKGPRHTPFEYPGPPGAPWWVVRVKPPPD